MRIQALQYGDTESITGSISDQVDKVVVSYTPSSYSASVQNLSFGDNVSVNTAISAGVRYDTIYSYQPSTYIASKYTPSSYTASKHSYKASSYDASSATKIDHALYKKVGDSYVMEFAANVAYKNYYASAYTKETHSYTASKYEEESYTASSYVASSLVKKSLDIQYTPSSYTKSSLKVKPVEIQLGTFVTRDITALTI